MKENFLTFSRVACLIGIALLVMVANVVASILYMVVYGHLIDPGHEQAYYDAHIQAAAPYCSIVAGIPLMFFAGWWVGRWWRGGFAIQSALVIWLVYVLIDFSVILLAGAMTPTMAVLFSVSFATKLAAVYFGAQFANARRAQ